MLKISWREHDDQSVAAEFLAYEDFLTDMLKYLRQTHLGMLEHHNIKIIKL